GKLDLVTNNRGQGSFGVLLGNGDGSFQPPKTSPTTFYGYEAAAVADINGDGKPDFLAIRNLSVVPVLGHGDGSFQTPPAVAAGFIEVQALVAADVNGDVKPDVITTSADVNTVEVLLGNGDGTVQPQRSFAVGPYPNSVAVADVNGDGKPDLVTGNTDS